MRLRRWTLALVTAVALATPLAAQAASPVWLDQASPEARTLITNLEHQDFAALLTAFTPNVRQQVPVDRLKFLWDGMVNDHGPFQGIGDGRIHTFRLYEVLLLPLRFGKVIVPCEIVIQPDHLATSLWFSPAEYPASQNPPAYAKPDHLHEQEVTVGSAPWQLPGTLTRPNGPGPFPAVVLVHGSGPNDRDESIGPNKVFRDLAWGLASRGIAVLRYEKRTRELGAIFKFTDQQVTPDNETVDDAAEAVRVLMRTPGIDPTRVFVVGHSLGGQMLPRIAARVPQAAGLIGLAAACENFADAVLRQTRYQFELDGPLSDEQKAYLADLTDKVARANDPALAPETPPSKLPLGVDARYLLYLRAYHPDIEAQTVKLPMFFLQGDRDYQVTVDGSFQRFQRALANRSDVRFTIYPGLNHMFLRGTGAPNSQEYFTPGHVAPEVVSDIADWILAITP